MTRHPDVALPKGDYSALVVKNFPDYEHVVKLRLLHLRFSDGFGLLVVMQDVESRIQFKCKQEAKGGLLIDS